MTYIAPHMFTEKEIDAMEDTQSYNTLLTYLPVDAAEDLDDWFDTFHAGDFDKDLDSRIKLSEVYTHISSVPEETLELVERVKRGDNTDIVSYTEFVYELEGIGTLTIECFSSDTRKFAIISFPDALQFDDDNRTISVIAGAVRKGFIEFKEDGIYVEFPINGVESAMFDLSNIIFKDNGELLSLNALRHLDFVRTKLFRTVRSCRESETEIDSSMVFKDTEMYNEILDVIRPVTKSVHNASAIVEEIFMKSSAILSSFRVHAWSKDTDVRANYSLFRNTLKHSLNR